MGVSRGCSCVAKSGCLRYDLACGCLGHVSLYFQNSTEAGNLDKHHWLLGRSQASSYIYILYSHVASKKA